MEDGVTSFGGDSHVASTAGNTNGVKLNGDDANDSMWYGFIGTADGAVIYGLIYVIVLSFVIWFIAYLLYKRGYKIKF